MRAVLLMLVFLCSIEVSQAQTKIIHKVSSPDKNTVYELGINANRQVLYSVIHRAK